MKKRNFILLMAMVMMLVMSFSSMADEAKYYEGTVTVFVEDGAGEEEVPISAELINGHLEFEFYTSNGHHFKCWVDEFGYGDPGFHINNYVLIDDTYETQYGSAYYNTDGLLVFYSKAKYEREDDFGFYLNAYMLETENTTPHQIATPITGSTVSDSGNYMITVAGYFNKELTNDIHTLSASDIASQNITVVVVNISNGTVNVLNQSSIDEIIVTVSGGSATEFVISGNAQTAGGSSDTYTVIINP